MFKFNFFPSARFSFCFKTSNSPIPPTFTLLFRIVLLVIVSVFMLSCSDRVTQAGGTGTETTNGLSLLAFTPEGNPAVGFTVRLRPHDFLAGVNSDSDLIMDTVLDNSGHKWIAGLTPGSYSVEITDQRNYCVRIHVEMDAGVGMRQELRVVVYPGVRPILRLNNTHVPEGVQTELSLRGLQRQFLIQQDSLELGLMPASEVVPFLRFTRGGQSNVQQGSDLAPLVLRSEPMYLTLPNTIWERYEQIWPALQSWIPEESAERLWQRLYIYQNQLIGINLDSLNWDTLPAQIAGFTFLEYLNLKQNNLRTIPNFLVDSLNLYHIFLDGNPLDSFPTYLLQRPQLRYLGLGQMPGMLYPAELGNFSLEGIDLHRNQLLEFPPWILQLHELELLVLTGNNLAQIPGNMENLLGLQMLFLDSNQLQTLPSLVALQNLNFLMISDNPLDSLPADLGFLPGLRTLYAGRGRLRNLPPSLLQSQISTLDVVGNQICDRLSPAMEKWLDDIIGSPWRSRQPQNCP